MMLGSWYNSFHAICVVNQTNVNKVVWLFDFHSMDRVHYIMLHNKDTLVLSGFLWNMEHHCYCKIEWVFCYWMVVYLCVCVCACVCLCCVRVFVCACACLLTHASIDFSVLDEFSVSFDGYTLTDHMCIPLLVFCILYCVSGWSSCTYIEYEIMMCLL